MKDISVSDCMSITRLIAVYAKQYRTHTLMEPCSGFTAGGISEGFLEDVLKRNSAQLTNQDTLERAIGTMGRHAELVSYNYSIHGNTDIIEFVLMGIKVDEDTLWLTRSAPQPYPIVDLENLTQHALPVVKQPVKLAIAARTIDVLSPQQHFFHEIANLPDHKRGWLLTQMEAVFKRIGRDDLYENMYNLYREERNKK